MPMAKKGGFRGMFIRRWKNPLDTPLPEGIPWGKSPLGRGDFFPNN